ncbi:MAG: serine protease [Granulosicoccus sp.]
MRFLPAFIAVLILAGSIGTATAQSRTETSNRAIVDQRPLSARVLGGGDAEAGKYPSLVALVTPGFIPLEQRLFCGGTVVAERWILTAAHCVHDPFNGLVPPGFVRIVAGINDLALETPEQEHRALQIIVHPEYDGTLGLPPNDIALIELETAVAAPITTLFTGESEDYAGTAGFIAGWGAIEYSDPDNPVYPTKLQDASVPLVSLELCNAPESYNGVIAFSHVCAGYAEGEVDACAGDSGGPLYINVNGVRVQVGITSFGIGCGQPLFYGIYTDVSHFIPWLGEYIDVPFQSPDLVAERVRQENSLLSGGGSDNGSGSQGAGTFSIQGLWLLLFAVYVRQLSSRQDMNSERILSKLVCRISRPFTR